MAVKTYQLVRDRDNVLCPRPYTGNAMLIKESGCRYYMTVQPNGSVRVHAADALDFDKLRTLLVRCPDCASKMLPSDSMFNSNTVQVFHCIICKR